MVADVASEYCLDAVLRAELDACANHTMSVSGYLVKQHHARFPPNRQRQLGVVAVQDVIERCHVHNFVSILLCNTSAQLVGVRIVDNLSVSHVHQNTVGLAVAARPFLQGHRTPLDIIDNWGIKLTIWFDVDVTLPFVRRRVADTGVHPILICLWSEGTNHLQLVVFVILIHEIYAIHTHANNGVAINLETLKDRGNHTITCNVCGNVAAMVRNLLLVAEGSPL